jgi:hypothetical protein
VPTRCLVPLAVAALLLAGGCGSAAPATSPERAGAGGSLADITEKVESIAQDGCATKPAATVFPNCPRFIAEVANVANAVRGAAPGRAGAEALTTAATSATDATSAFLRDGCVLSPSQPAPSTETCGADLTRVQEALRAMRTALAAG